MLFWLFRKQLKLFSFIYLKMRKLKADFSNLCAIHAKRVTLMQKDIQLARRIRGPIGGISV